MGDPVALVDWLPQLLERVLGAEEGEIEDALEIVSRAYLQLLVELLDLVVIEQLVRIGDVCAHRLGLIQCGRSRLVVHPIHLKRRRFETLGDLLLEGFHRDLVIFFFCLNVVQYTLWLAIVLVISHNVLIEQQLIQSTLIVHDTTKRNNYMCTHRLLYKHIGHSVIIFVS